MVQRPFWLKRIREQWKNASLIWLSGVRRVGKTTLARHIEDARYVNCDTPANVRWLEDPEAFFRAVREPVLILDEVHQLADPSRVLKIAADEFPGLRVLATGSSTLAATRKFRDSLAGRMRHIHLVPVLAEELDAFRVGDCVRRLLRGGLPEALLRPDLDAVFYSEWLDSFFARDVVELFRVEKRSAFLRMMEMFLRRSGGMLDVTRAGHESGLSRVTAMNYLDALEITGVVHLLRPFHGGGTQELVRQPKVYGFDTGFVCHARGWDSLRPDDCGGLWEHLVLETLLTLDLPRPVHYWRDKTGREVDFVLPVSRNAVHAVEAKWTPDTFETRSFREFRRRYPHGENLVVSPECPVSVVRDIGGLRVRFLALRGLRRALTGRKGGHSSANGNDT